MAKRDLIKEAQDMLSRVENVKEYYKNNIVKEKTSDKKEKLLFEIYEPMGTYNGGRYISFNVTPKNIILREAIDWEVPDNERGGIISLSTDVNAVQLSDNKLINAIKQFILTWKQRLTYSEKVDKVAQKHQLVGWTIGKFLNGRYTGKNGDVFDENSISIEVVGVESAKLIEIAEDFCREFNQESVLLKDYNSGKILFVNSL